MSDRRLAKDNRTFPDNLQLIPPQHWPNDDVPNRIEVWRSRRFLVQVFSAESPGHYAYRMSVCRTELAPDGRWKEGITWDELQELKRQIGRGDYYAIEVYPRDVDLVNVANMRHLWILSSPLLIGWFNTHSTR